MNTLPLSRGAGWILRALFVVLGVFGAIAPALAQAPPLPDGLAQDPRLTWRPALNPTATVTLDAQDVVTVWRSGQPVVVPTAGRSGLAVALEQLANDSGEWLGFTGRHGAVQLGDKVGTEDCARPQGFSGISIVGLDSDPSSSDWAVLGGFQIDQRIGLQKDLAFLNLAIDSWTNRPCMVGDGDDPAVGNLYLESIRAFAIPNDLKGQTAKGASCTTWLFKIHGSWRLHVLALELRDGVVPGDGLGGTSEHVFYLDALLGDSELLDSYLHGAQISGFYCTTRYQNRLRSAGGWVERYSQGRLLIDGTTFHDCGVMGSWAVNICGGVQHVTLRNLTYRVNLDGYALSGQVPGGKWAGGAAQVYVDKKQFELDTGTAADPIPISSKSVPKALGYSMEPSWNSLPESPDTAAMNLPWDGYGGARSFEVIGGTFEGANIYPPLFNLRDVALVTFVESQAGVAPFRVRGAGKTAAFAASGPLSQCGPAQEPGATPGRVPAALSSAYGQQARFKSRALPSKWFGSVKINGTAVSPADLDTWAWRAP